ncbi:hypothetical protein ACROAE_17930 [Shewanella sp. MF05960]|uniref:hypothetical protein n=1 Tax=Shewanella sp. MF05960 TaxID=3434874 RepID=UPI003D7B144A
MADYLYQYATLEKHIKNYIKTKQYELAWTKTFNLDEIALKHVATFIKPPLDWVLCFTNNGSEYRAVILSKEGKHIDALFNGTLRALVEHRPIAKYEQKMMVYFRKAKLKCTEASFLEMFEQSKKSRDIKVFEKLFRELIGR